MGAVWSVLGILAGMLLALQGPINAQLARALGSPIAAAAMSFIAGTIVLTLITLATVQAQGISIAWRAPPLWMLFAGGCLGAIFVTCALILTPKLGVAATMCEELDWQPHKWQPIAVELRKLTGKRKVYRWVDGHRRRAYPV